MAYIGRQPSYGAFEKQSLTADSSTTTFSLNYTVGSSSSILVSVAGVIQEPETGYNLTGGGTSIVFSAAPTTGDTVFVIFLGIARDVGQFLNSGIITAQTAETSVADGDQILVYDVSASALRKMTKANFSPTVTLTYLNRTATGDGSTAGFTVTLGAGASQSGFGRTGTVDWQTGSIKTSTFTAVSGEGYFCNTSSGAFTCNLPAGSAGAIVSLADYAGTWQTNNLTVSPNGTDKIGSVNADVILNTEGQSVTFVYVDSTQGWINTMDSTSNVRGNPNFNITYLCNLAGKEKLWINQNMWRSSSGAGIAPGREEGVGKWANTSNAVSTFTYHNWHTGNYDTNSQAIVLGYNPDDTHTDNFWEELSSVTTTSSGSISSGTITAKKYLMYQIIGKKASGTGTEAGRFQFNGDTASNYAQRNGINGTHYTYGTQSSANIGGDGNTAGEMVFLTGFIINKANTEKLFLGFSAYGSTAGNYIGNKGEIFDKWTGTAQITSIECMGTTFEAGAKMTIWGSD